MTTMTMTDPEPLLTPEEVAARLSVKPSWVYRAARTGALPCVRVGRWVRFLPDEVDAWIARGGASDE